MLKSLVAGGLLGVVQVPIVRRALLARHVAVLMYHDLCADDVDIEAWTVVRRADFVHQLRHVRQHYDVVSLDEAIDASGRERRRPLAVFTFDDGLAGNHDVLLPIVEAERLPVTVFVATEHIERQVPYWFDRIVNALNLSQPLALDLRQFDLGVLRFNDGRGAQNWRRIQALLTRLKACSPQQQLAVVEAVEAQTGSLPRAHPWRLRPMSIEALQRLAASDFVTIGAHSHEHQVLPRMGLDAARASIARSRDLLRQWTGQAVDHFAYPSGAYDGEVMRVVQELGFRTAVTTESGFWTERVALHAIPRIAVGRYDSAAVFGINLLGGLRRFMRFAGS